MMAPPPGSSVWVSRLQLGPTGSAKGGFHLTHPQLLPETWETAQRPWRHRRSALCSTAGLRAQQTSPRVGEPQRAPKSRACPRARRVRAGTNRGLRWAQLPVVPPEQPVSKGSRTLVRLRCARAMVKGTGDPALRPEPDPSRAETLGRCTGAGASRLLELTQETPLPPTQGHASWVPKDRPWQQL